jgi:DNA-binding MarR family transcriptional regulator
VKVAGFPSRAEGAWPSFAASAPQLLHCLLFVQEFPKAAEANRSFDLSPISFFLSRSGGLHVLLLLLNAAFYKDTPLKQIGGWPFGVLAGRVDISQRSLRKLLADAVAEGHVLRRHGKKDQRRNQYCATPKLISAWSALCDNLAACVPDVLSSLTSDKLVDVDYRKVNPDRPVENQIPPPADTLYLKSANNNHRKGNPAQPVEGHIPPPQDALYRASGNDNLPLGRGLR